MGALLWIFFKPKGLKSVISMVYSYDSNTNSDVWGCFSSTPQSSRLQLNEFWQHCLPADGVGSCRSQIQSCKAAHFSGPLEASDWAAYRFSAPFLGFNSPLVQLLELREAFHSADYQCIIRGYNSGPVRSEMHRAGCGERAGSTWVPSPKSPCVHRPRSSLNPVLLGSTN